MNTVSIIFVALFSLLIIFTVEIAGDDQLLCRICNRIKQEVDNVSKLSRLRQLPKFKNFIDHNVPCISPCSRYTENITCTLCNFLLEIGEEWKEKPEEVFVDRLEYSCSTMDFMYPVCNMIVEEHSDKLYSIIKAGVSHHKACGELQLCLPDDPAQMAQK